VAGWLVVWAAGHLSTLAALLRRTDEPMSGFSLSPFRLSQLKRASKKFVFVACGHCFLPAVRGRRLVGGRQEGLPLQRWSERGGEGRKKVGRSVGKCTARSHKPERERQGEERSQPEPALRTSTRSLEFETREARAGGLQPISSFVSAGWPRKTSVSSLHSRRKSWIFFPHLIILQPFHGTV